MKNIHAMFNNINPMERMERKYKAKTRNKVLLFSFLSSLVSGFFAFFFSQKENQQMIKQRAKEAREKGFEFKDKVMEKAGDVRAEIKPTISNAQSKMHEVASNLKGQITNRFNKVKDDTSDLKNKTQDKVQNVKENVETDAAKKAKQISQSVQSETDQFLNKVQENRHHNNHNN